MSHVRWRVTALVMGLCFISHLNRASMSVAGTGRIMDEAGLTPTRMGWVYTAFLLTYSLCMIPGGMFIDRKGTRIALMWVGFGSAVFGVLTGLLGWLGLAGALLLPLLIGIRGLMGMVSAPLHPAGARVIGHWFPPAQQSWANGIVTAAAIAGVAASYPFFGALMNAVGWQSGFILCAGLTALLALAWSKYATDDPESHPSVHSTELNWIRSGSATEPSSRESRDGGWKDLLRNRSLILVTLSYAAVGYFQYLFVYWMQYYFDRVLHLGSTASQYYASFLQVALALGMPLGGWLSALIGRRQDVRRGRAIIAGGGMALSAVLLGLGVAASQPFWIVLWFAAAHAALGASEGPIWATAVDIGGRRGGTAAAICNTGGNVGGLIAPVLTPFIGETVGWGWAIALGGSICLLGAFCWAGIDPAQGDTKAATV